MDSEMEIRATIEPWRQASLDRDWDTLLSLCTPDVVFSPPAEPNVFGEPLRAWLETFPPMKELTLGMERIDVSGDLAVAAGQGAWTMEMDGRLVHSTFKFLDRLQRVDGVWRYAHVCWNLNDPLSEL